MMYQEETPPDTAMSGSVYSASLSTFGMVSQYTANCRRCKYLLGEIK